MLTTLALFASLLALGAAPDPSAESGEARPAPQPSAGPPMPRLERGAPVMAPNVADWCLRRGGGPLWRAQCDEATKVCLVAPNVELDSDLKPAGRLDRAYPCSPMMEEEQLLAQGYRFVDAVVESPPGWRRDGRGRVMQAAFDMNRRLWLGGGYSLPWGSGPGLGWASLSVGFRGEWANEADIPTLYRLSLFNGDAAVNLSWLEATVAHFDTSRGGKKPPVHLTTFFGTPERHDLDISLGFWADLVAVELHDVGARHHARVEVGALGGTLDLWHSRDLGSFVRLRADADIEEDRTLRVWKVAPAIAAEADVTLTDSGLHHLRVLAQYERVVPLTAGAPQANRARFKLGYEIGIVAINDQPLSALIEGRADLRGDLPDLPETWEYQAAASLRFSFWVPARRGATAQTSL